MKNTLFILLFFPIFIFSQTSNGYFNFSKEMFYHEQMSKWKDKVYSDKDCKFETVIDNDSIFAFSARGYFFKELYQLNLDEKKRIKKIEIFFSVHNGNLEEWFPYKYPMQISEVFKKLGDPNITKNNYIHHPINPLKDAEYTFENYNKWNNVLFKDTEVVLEIANLKAKIPIRNKKGKIKKYESKEYAYISKSAKSKGDITETDKNLNATIKISDGFIKLWQRNRSELITMLGQERFDISDAWTDITALTVLFAIKNTNNPKEYFQCFNNIGITLFDFDLVKYFNVDEKFTYTSLSEGTLARSVGMNNSRSVEILIDIENWNDSSYLDKYFIMFHELGHDVFDLEHNDGIRIMTTNKISFDNPSLLGEMIFEMMFFVLKKQGK